MKLACVVPALDAADALPGVLAGLRASVPDAVVIVVDDGSRDDTPIVAASADVVIRHNRTLGKGAALRTGIDAALRSGAALVATVDADGQHAPGALPSMIDAAKDADLVLGCRRRSGTAMPLQRRMSNWISSRMVSVIAGCRIDDSQCGLRVIRADVLRYVTASGDRYEYETEIVVGAARAGYAITSVAIPTTYGARSHFRSVRDTWRVGLALARLALTPAH